MPIDLSRHGHAAKNPVGEVERPAIDRDEGAILVFSKVQARKMFDAPLADTIAGLRDRAILSVGLQVGLRRAESLREPINDRCCGRKALRCTEEIARMTVAAFRSPGAAAGRP